jgi:hypothetical protein
MNPAFIYKHTTNGSVRVVEMENARLIDGHPDWDHVATVNSSAVLQYLIELTSKERDEYIEILKKKHP